MKKEELRELGEEFGVYLKLMEIYVPGGEDFKKRILKNAQIISKALEEYSDKEEK